MTEQPNIETTTPTHEEAHEIRVPRDKKALTHRIPPAQLANIRRCLVDPIAAAAAQNQQNYRHKNGEGRKRSLHSPKDSPMQHEQVTPTQNGSQVQPSPPPVPRTDGSRIEQTMQAIVAVPYKQVALRGLIFGAAGSVTWALGMLGVKKLIARFSANPADSDGGFSG